MNLLLKIHNFDIGSFNNLREVEKRQTESCVYDALCRVGQLRKPDTHLAVAMNQPFDSVLPQVLTIYNFIFIFKNLYISQDMYVYN